MIGKMSYPNDRKNATDVSFSGSIRAANISSPFLRRTGDQRRTSRAAIVRRRKLGSTARRLIQPFRVSCVPRTVPTSRSPSKAPRYESAFRRSCSVNERRLSRPLVFGFRPHTWKSAMIASKSDRRSGRIRIAMGLLLPGDEMPGRSREMVPDIAGELVAEERGHQLNPEKTCEREQPHANVRFAARDVSGRIRGREGRAQIDEKVEPDLVCRDPFDCVEILVHVDELFRFDIEAALLIEFAAQTGCEALAEFQVAAGQRIDLASPLVDRFLGEDRLLVNQDAARADQEFAARITRSEHRAPPPCRAGSGC